MKKEGIQTRKRKPKINSTNQGGNNLGGSINQVLTGPISGGVVHHSQVIPSVLSHQTLSCTNNNHHSNSMNGAGDNNICKRYFLTIDPLSAVPYPSISPPPTHQQQQHQQQSAQQTNSTTLPLPLSSSIVHHHPSAPSSSSQTNNSSMECSPLSKHSLPQDTDGSENNGNGN